ncbi:hypothetical protein PR001_g19481 [Phytophthora rubi]|uniref:Uncharacterized protein n=1 Tax=Phytophthora rubi TaxID=129364 RepID=A0A6A3JRQ5_9STRA|nr:hypothetical protein PR001_g19481 [Phytophthora rubi]
MKGMATMSLTKGYKCLATLNPTMAEMKGMTTLSLTKGFKCMATLNLTMTDMKGLATPKPTMSDMKGMTTLSLTNSLRLMMMSPLNPERTRSDWQSSLFQKIASWLETISYLFASVYECEIIEREIQN